MLLTRYTGGVIVHIQNRVTINEKLYGWYDVTEKCTWITTEGCR
jgi:hypothetical protein